MKALEIQGLFEHLNSEILPLTNGDLCRNLLLMNGDFRNIWLYTNGDLCNNKLKMT